MSEQDKGIFLGRTRLVSIGKAGAILSQKIPSKVEALNPGTQGSTYSRGAKERYSIYPNSVLA